MKINITNQQLTTWIDKRAVELAENDPRTAHLRNDSNFKLGILEQTFRSLLNNPSQRRELMKEIAGV